VLKIEYVMFFVFDICHSTKKYLEKDFDTKAPFSLALSCRFAA